MAGCRILCRRCKESEQRRVQARSGANPESRVTGTRRIAMLSRAPCDTTGLRHPSMSPVGVDDHGVFEFDRASSEIAEHYRARRNVSPAPFPSKNGSRGKNSGNGNHRGRPKSVLNLLTWRKSQSKSVNIQGGFPGRKTDGGRVPHPRFSRVGPFLWIPI
jgi:hypothetical protein